MNNLRVIMFG